MDESKMYTIEESHLFFAKTLNGKVWELLQKTGRSKSEDELMIHSAHASCYHWLQAGTGLHHQRAEWLIAHVYTELEIPDSSLRHATRCLELTNEFAGLMMDFDRAYAYEAIARANALVGNRDEALRYILRADEIG